LSRLIAKLIGLPSQVIAITLTVHGLLFLLLQVLPTASVIEGGLFSLSFKTAAPSEGEFVSYFDSVRSLLTFSPGRSLDNLPVLTLLKGALSRSGPHGVLAIVIVIGATCIAGSMYRSFRPAIGNMLLALPAFLPVALLSVLVTLLNAGQWASIHLAAAVSVAPAIFIAATVSRLMHFYLKSPWATAHLAQGATAWQVRRRLWRNVLADALPSVVSTYSLFIVSLLFAEYMSGTGGLGALIVLAIQRGDVAVSLFVLPLLAATLSTFRVFCNELRCLLDPRNSSS
jgi:ABC-type dipeptide/oligopeptide/nickel transport system permease component